MLTDHSPCIQCHHHRLGQLVGSLSPAIPWSLLLSHHHPGHHHPLNLWITKRWKLFCKPNLQNLSSPQMKARKEEDILKQENGEWFVSMERCEDLLDLPNPMSGMQLQLTNGFVNPWKQHNESPTLSNQSRGKRVPPHQQVTTGLDTYFMYGSVWSLCLCIIKERLLCGIEIHDGSKYVRLQNCPWHFLCLCYRHKISPKKNPCHTWRSTMPQNTVNTSNYRCHHSHIHGKVTLHTLFLLRRLASFRGPDTLLPLSSHTGKACQCPNLQANFWLVLFDALV